LSAVVEEEVVSLSGQGRYVGSKRELRQHMLKTCSAVAFKQSATTTRAIHGKDVEGEEAAGATGAGMCCVVLKLTQAVGGIEWL